LIRERALRAFVLTGESDDSPTTCFSASTASTGRCMAGTPGDVVEHDRFGMVLYTCLNSASAPALSPSSNSVRPRSKRLAASALAAASGSAAAAVMVVRHSALTARHETCFSSHVT